jgi:tetratricopeptide (TPR) repeat protein
MAMKQEALFPSYVTRTSAEAEIRQVATRVQNERASRLLMLYGPGGVGKTRLVRHLSEIRAPEGIIWLEPIDVDDSEFWLMANLERRIAERLNFDGGHFQEYLDRVTELPRYERLRVGRETVLAHLRWAGEVFHRCYEEYVTRSQRALVITLDTVETIRGTDMVLSLTQWIKRLPSTLFILSGRPMYNEQRVDPLVEQFKPERSQPLPFGIVRLTDFAFEEAMAYLDNGRLTRALSPDEKEKIVLLTQGHPLWLALAVDYLDKAKMPEATAVDLAELKTILPYQAKPLPDKGQQLHEDFVRSVIIPYRESDFQHEAIKRLAVVRRRMNRVMWEALMADRHKEVADWEIAWNDLLRQPWIRSRANSQFITLHDALAEELGYRIIPLQGENWYRQQWKAMKETSADLITRRKPEIEQEQTSLDESLKEIHISEEEQRQLVDRVRQLDTRVRELDDLKAAYLYYQMLCDFQSGYQLFASQFDEATRQHEFRLRELLWMEMQRFLPGESVFDPSSDIVRPTIERFRQWLAGQPYAQYEIGQRGAEYLVDSGRALEAEGRLSKLLEQFKGDLEKEYRLFNLRGNARMKIPSRIQEAEADFQEALKRTQNSDASDALRRLQGQAYKEIGFYYRNIGKRQDAANSYSEALRLTLLSEQRERASIQTNWAYVEALGGGYQKAKDLVETGLATRRRLRLHREIGMSLSVQGETRRYARDFSEAWAAYEESAAIFEIAGDWAWLGMVYQEQAICLFQAATANKVIGEYGSTDAMLEQACALVLQALDICRDQSIRAYPSALNRAGRILGSEDDDRGIMYLEEGVRQAKELGDGWFHFANLIELAELYYRAWVKTGDYSYRIRIESLSADIEQVGKDYAFFFDLSGRWDLLQGHLAVHNALVVDNEMQRESQLDRALEHYKRGFLQLVKGFVGSHGAAAVSTEFDKFGKLLAKLPPITRENWCQELLTAWSDKTLGYLEEQEQPTSLVAHLTRMYAEYVANPQQQQEVAS